MDYKKAGVDIEAGYKSVELMKEHIKKTIKASKNHATKIGYINSITTKRMTIIMAGRVKLL